MIPTGQGYLLAMQRVLAQSQVVAMIDEDQGGGPNGSLLPFQCQYNFDNMMTRACLRLGQIADSERLMGFKESAELYADTSTDLKLLRVWVHEAIEEAFRSESSE